MPEESTFNPDAMDAVLFDLDGTLMDTDDQVTEWLALWLRRLGWPRPRRSARRFVMAAETPMNTLIALLDVVGMDGLLMGITHRLRRRRGRRERPNFRIIPGAREMLVALDGRYRLAVVTTRGHDDAEAFLSQHGLRDFFDVVVTRESTWRLKPHPGPLRHAAQLLDVSVERCTMVGDTTADVRAARRAGAKAVAVLSGFGRRGELEQADPHALLEDVSQLSSLFCPDR